MRTPRSRSAPRSAAAAAAPPSSAAAAPADPVVHELANLYVELMMRRADRLRSLTSELELTPSQARTLALMEPAKSLTMSELAQAVMLEPSNLTGVIDKLEGRGLVTRGLAATDRRVKLVSLTRAGAALRAQLWERLREPAPWMLALSERDQRQLLLILRKGLAFEQQSAGAKS